MQYVITLLSQLRLKSHQKSPRKGIYYQICFCLKWVYQRAGLAWDNYDELTKTLSGKDTLHDTVGICYQNIHVVPQTMELEQYLLAEDVVTSKRPVKRRRQFEPPERHIVPYKKSPHFQSSAMRFAQRLHPPV
jgi:hypothetical protein